MSADFVMQFLPWPFLSIVYGFGMLFMTMILLNASVRSSALIILFILVIGISNRFAFRACRACSSSSITQVDKSLFSRST